MGRAARGYTQRTGTGPLNQKTGMVYRPFLGLVKKLKVEPHPGPGSSHTPRLDGRLSQDTGCSLDIKTEIVCVQRVCLFVPGQEPPAAADNKKPAKRFPPEAISD